MTVHSLHAMVAEARSVRIESEIARRGIQLQGRTAERYGPCPVCGGTDRFSINIRKQVWNCRRCVTGGEVSAGLPARHLGFKPFEKNTLRGFFDIELASGLILRGCTLHEKNGRRWVGLPAKPYATDTGAQSWAAIVDFRNKRTAAQFQELATAAAVAAYERGGQ